MIHQEVYGAIYLFSNNFRGLMAHKALVGNSKSASAKGITNDCRVSLPSGYKVVTADIIEAACEMAKDCALITIICQSF